MVAKKKWFIDSQDHELPVGFTQLFFAIAELQDNFGQETMLQFSYPGDIEELFDPKYSGPELEKLYTTHGGNFGRYGTYTQPTFKEVQNSFLDYYKNTLMEEPFNVKIWW